MAALYTNENFPQPAVAELRRRGHDVRTTHEANQSNISASDLEVVRLATSGARIVVTLNRRDFIRIHQSGEQHEGIIVCTTDKDFLALASRVDAAILGRASFKNQLVRVDRGTVDAHSQASRRAGSM